MMKAGSFIVGTQRVAGVLLLACALPGCGQKGPLYLPAANQAAPAAPQKPAEPGTAPNSATR